MSVDTLNEQLHNLYRSHWSRLARELPTDEGLSNPQFMKIPQEYERADCKLLIVGQQTNGWGVGSKDAGFGADLGNDPADELMSLYQRFELGRKYTKSPFWVASHKIYKALNPQGEPEGFAWSNLVKIDQNRFRPAFEYENIVSKCELLQAECKLLKPDVVVFFTGPDYDPRLLMTFPGLQMSPVIERALFVLEHEALPAHSYRTYHPNYLRRSKQWEILDRIIALASP